MDRRSSTCASFVSNDGSDDLVVRYQWGGEAIGLELMRETASNVVRTVHWGEDPLGVTLGVEETSRRVFVTRSSRPDVQVGDVLVEAQGELITEYNLAERLAMLKKQHALNPDIPFVFAPPPPPVFVKKCAGELNDVGVDSSFELRYVNGRVSPKSFFFLEISFETPTEASKELKKRRFHKPKKTKTVQEPQDKDLKLKVKPHNANEALEVLEALQKSDSSGLSQDLAKTLLATLITEKKLDKALELLELCGKQMLRLPTISSQLVCNAAMLAAHRAEQGGVVQYIVTQMVKDAKPHKDRAIETALSAALNSKLFQLVLDIVKCVETLDIKLTVEHYHFVLKIYAWAGDMQAALSTRDMMQENGLVLTDDGLYWLVHCACKLDLWELVQELLAHTTPSGQVSVNAYNSAISAYGNANHWPKVLGVYGMMPENLRAELKGWHFGVVITAYAKADSKELKLQVVDIFNKHKAKATKFAYGDVVTALVETDQFDAALEIIKDMKNHGIMSGKGAYRAVTLALIRHGSAQEAKELLEEFIARMGDSPERFLDIIQFYADRRQSEEVKQE
ncbi:hypothetical protein BBJ29_006587 [Phytophthora kernoviae]|uniref:Pentatricopeptide repeat-containing protein-mitochondrial domain-containing protein n=1 Tax=Phytophthora kernoviae TaxID=325452 RepID=A0A3R7JRA8_9STRA|nr:hypothetical protein BBJ29_006587 [Phytophthora kernoviae]